MKQIIFKNYLNNKSIGSIIDRLVIANDVKFSIDNNKLYLSEVREITFEEILDWCCNKINNYIESNKYSIQSIEKMMNYLEIIEKYRDNLISEHICPDCGRYLNVRTKNESKGQAFGFEKFEQVSNIKCKYCNYKDTIID